MKVPQVSFSSGEVSPSLYARVDLARYQTALKRCLNFFVRPQGGISNRPGTPNLGNTKYPDKQSRLIPFIFSVDQAYMLEVGDTYIRVLSNGAYVSTSASVSISTVTDGAVRTITTSAVHGLTAGQDCVISGMTATGTYAINGTWRVLSTPTTSSFTIAGSNDPTGLMLLPGLVAPVFELMTNYIETDLEDLAWTQSADVLTLVHPSYPQKEFRRLTANSFELVDVEYRSGPFEDVNADDSIFIHSNKTKGVVTLTATGSVFNSLQIGALLYLDEWRIGDEKPWEPGKSVVGYTSRRSDGKVYRALTSATTGTVKPTHDSGVASDGEVGWEYRHNGRGIVRITAVASGTSATAITLTRIPPACVGGATTSVGPFNHTGDGTTTVFACPLITENDETLYSVTLNGVLASQDNYFMDAVSDTLNFYDAPANGVAIVAYQLSANNRTPLWAFGAWSYDNGFPSEVEYYSDRLVFAATRAQPQTLWFSKTNSYRDFGESTPLVDDDAINVTLNSRQLNAVQEIVPLDNLLILTSGGEWRTGTGASEAFTPSTVGFKPQSFYGAKNLPSIIVGGTALFVQERGSQVRDFLYTFEVESYVGTDLSILSNHLLVGKKIIDWCHQSVPDGIIWIVQDDGGLRSLTYMREHEVVGWAQHVLGGGDAIVESIECIPGTSEDEVYMVVSQPVNGVENRTIRRFATREIGNIIEAVFLDASLSYDGRNTSPMTMMLTGSAWTVNDTQTLTASSAFFASTDIGDSIALDYGLSTELFLEITGYTSVISVTVRPARDVPLSLQAVAVSGWGFARNELHGLEHLEGRTVSALADGEVVSGLVVSGNKVTLPSPSVFVTVGLPYNSDAELLDLNVPGGPPVRDHSKSVSKVAFVLEKSRGLWAGPDETRLNEYVGRTTEGYSDPTSLLTGLAEIYVRSTWSKNGSVFIRQPDPLPLTILSVTPEITVGGSG